MTEPGESQNSASSGVIFSTRIFGSSALSHQAFAGVENSSLILARSLETAAVPVTETYFWSPASAKDRLMFGIAGDFLVLVAARVGEEIDRVVLALEIGAHRPRAKLVAVAVTSIAKPIFFIRSQARSTSRAVLSLAM